MSVAKATNYKLRHGIMLPPETESVLHGYKEPLTSVLEGYGYIGTLAYNKPKTHVQCHICGYFFKSLSQHVRLVHAMKPKEYKDRYSLMRKTSLLAPVTRQKLVENTQVDSVWLRKKRSKDQIIKNLKKGWDKPRGKQPETLEQKNKKGRCPEQLLRKVLVLSEELNKVPTRREFIKKYGDNGDIKSIYRTFGSWNSVIEELGMVPNKTTHALKADRLREILERKAA